MVYSYNGNVNFGNNYTTTATVAQRSWEQAAAKEMGEVSKTSDSVFSGVLGAAAFEGVIKSGAYIKQAKAAEEGIKFGQILKNAKGEICDNFGTIKDVYGNGKWKNFDTFKGSWKNAWEKTSANAAENVASGSQSKLVKWISGTKLGQKVTATVEKCPKTLGKFTKYAKGSGVGIMMAIDGAVELVTNVVPTFQQLGTKSGVKQIFKSGTKVAASAGGWVAGTAAATALGTAICPGIGTVAGAIVGVIGGMLGSNVASKLVTKIFGKSELEKAADKQQLQAPRVANQQVYQQMYQQVPQTYSYMA